MKSRQKGKKKGSSKERVFGCDLQEHLQHSGQEVPQVLKSCAEFVEEYGVVDGIYRLSGVSSNIQKLRQEFESERKPDLRRDVYLQDIHCVSSLCKAYFRELPDPLLTYRLYDKFAEAVGVQLEPERLVKILEVLRELPVPNYRTLEFLMTHLVHMASFSAQTNMHARNLAIVWAPNLLRSKDIEASGFNGTAAFMEVRVQSIVVEFILTHVDQLFGGAALSGGEVESGWRSLPGTRASGSPEDLMPRPLPYHLPSILQAGDGPPQMRPYHTIIEIAEHKRKGSLKVRKWRSIFNLGRSGHETKRKLPRGAEDREDKSNKGTLRPAKSMDSLSAAAGASDADEKLEASPASSPLADSGTDDLAPALEDSLSQEVEEFSVEPPLDDLSLDEAQFVLAPSCCSLDSAGPRPEVEEENGEEVFLSAYDDLSPLLGPKSPIWEGAGSLEGEAAGCGRQAPGQAGEEQACWEVGEDKEAEPGGRLDIMEEAEGNPETKVEAGKASEDTGEAGGRQETKVRLREGSREETEAKEEKFKGQKEADSMEAKSVEEPEEQYTDEGKEKEIEREEAEQRKEAQVEAERDLEQGAQEDQVAEEKWEVVHKQEADGVREDEDKGQRGKGDYEARKDQGDGEDSRSPEAATEGGAGEVSKEWESGDGEAEGDQRAGGDYLEEGTLSEGSGVESLEVDCAEEDNPHSSEMEEAAPQPPQPEEKESEGQPSSDGCLCPCSLGLGGVGMRLASTLVQVQQVRSVPVVPPKPQFAKMPSAMCSKIHVAPANPSPRPGRLDATPGERAWGPRASRSSWRNGGSLSFDAAVALARDRQRTEAQGVRRTQTCTEGGDYCLIPRNSPCSIISAHSPRPLSCLEIPPEGTEGSGSRSRLSLPPREPQVPDTLLSPQRRSYAFETQANPEKGEGL
ncbi:rho GTPase-activating protein 30 isoform X7 [Trachypithecus francoisi]|uniref:rho GTPase-activating protein 30 isoform X7 n=1 Tax=Trachypithecus francoisi TaxID=54180 RepID=UPI00141B41E3|nr:rho GTPase-activating protein 30 isoform X7 [Trachypithecus francoisi]